MVAKSRWWISELLAAGCEKAWNYTGWEDIMQKWKNWLEEMKKKDEKEKMEEMHQQQGGKCRSPAQNFQSPQHGGDECRSW